MLCDVKFMGQLTVPRNRYAESLLERKRSRLVRELLDSDEALFREIKEQLDIAKNTLIWKVGAMSLLQRLQGILTIPNASTMSALYVKGMSGQLPGSPEIRTLLLHIKKASPEILAQMLSEVQDAVMTMPPSDVDISPDAFADIQDQLTDLLAQHADDSQPPRNIISEERPMIPIAGRKRGANGQATSQKREQDTIYSQLIKTFCESIESYFSHTLGDYRDIFLHEILVYDLKSPHADVFSPKTRFVIERALSSPHDYLGCSCCVSLKVSGLR